MNTTLRPAVQQALAIYRSRRSRFLHARAILALLLPIVIGITAVALLDRARLIPEMIRPWLSFSVYAFAIYWGWKKAWQLLADARSDTGAARLLEQVSPECQNQLLAAVELAQPAAPHVSDSAEFRAQLQDRVAASVARISWSNTIPWQQLKRPALTLLLACLLITPLAAIPNLHFPAFLARAALPFVTIERPTSVRITILQPSPADTTAPFLSDLEITATISGDLKNQSVYLETQSTENPTRRLEMALTQADTFELALPIGQNNLRYRILAADAITDWHEITARPRPAIQEFVKIITPPAYTGFPAQTLTSSLGDLEALEGSSIELRLTATQAIRSAELQLNPTDPDPPPASPFTLHSPVELRSTLSLTPELHTWQTSLTAAETGFLSHETSHWRITPIADNPPTVSFTEPADSTILRPDQAIHLHGVASDDVGLRSASLKRSINAGEPLTIDIPITTAATDQDLGHLLNLAPLSLSNGDSLILQWLVTDLKGQTTESQSIRIIIQEQSVDPRLRTWAEQQQRIANTANTLETQTKELKDAASKLKKDLSLAKRNQAANDPEGQLARLRAALESSQKTADELWDQTRLAAQNAPDPLARAEAAILGQRIAKLRQATLPAMDHATANQVTDTDPIRKQASDAGALADTIKKASQLFAAEATARIAAQHSEQLKRQQANLTRNALDSNRDAQQRPRWQEQQRAALASVQSLDQDLQQLQQLSSDRSQTRALEEKRAQLQDTAQDLRDSLDTPDQNKSPEHLYGASDNLRNRLQSTADQTRSLAEAAASRAAQLREQLNKQDNPALASLDEAKSTLKELAAETKRLANDPKAKPRNRFDPQAKAEQAMQKLTATAKQLEDQAELQGQSTDLQAAAAALETNRLSRAAQQLADQTQTAYHQPDASDQAAQLEQAATQTGALSTAARTLQAAASLEAASQNLYTATAAENAMLDGRRSTEPQSTPAATQAAAEALRQTSEALKRSSDAKDSAALAQQAADQAAKAAQHLAAQEQQTLQNPEHQASPSNSLPEAAQLAQQAAESLAPLTDAARQTLTELTPAVSQMMKQLAQNLQATGEETQNAADQAKQEQPLEEVAQTAQQLQPATDANTERMESLQAALRQEANLANLAQADQRQLARNADVALAQMRQQAPRITENLKQAVQASQSQTQAQSLQNAADAQQQTADALNQLAENFARMETGETLTPEDLAAMQQMENELGIQQALDQAYDRAEALANLEETARENPAAALALLEQELKGNPSMQKALAEVGKETAQTTESQLATQANQPALLTAATADAAHELERVARHQNRLEQQDAAATVAEAAQTLQQTTQETQSNPAALNPQTAQAANQAAQQATAAAQTSAASLLPQMNATLAELVQASTLAQALDQLDQTLNPRAGSPGDANQDGQTQSGDGAQQQPGDQQSGDSQQSQQNAQQNLANAQQSQQQSMAQSRNQGQTPGSQPPQQNMAQNSPPPAQNAEQSSEGGNFQTLVQEGELAGNIIMVPGDWGHLPASTAEGLTEATRQDAPPEYRAAIENYYKAISTKARR